MMTDPKAGKANIKKKKPVPNYSLYEASRKLPSRFQRNVDVKVVVSDYNSKAGTLKL